jgi:hypothetical protein
LSEQNSANPAAEQTAVTSPTVVEGLGYPADRKEISPEATGWLGVSDNANVSRETLGVKN